MQKVLYLYVVVVWGWLNCQHLPTLANTANTCTYLEHVQVLAILLVEMPTPVHVPNMYKCLQVLASVGSVGKCW